MAAVLVEGTREAARSGDARGARLAGLAGLVFIGAVVVQNVLRSSEPKADATGATVTSYFLGHRAGTLVSLALFPLGMLALFLFVSHVAAGEATGGPWARLGVLGSAVLGALFSLVSTTDVVLRARAADLAATPGVVQALWALHGAAFAMNLAAIGVALLGLSRAALAQGMIPRWLASAALAGTACLVVAAAFAVAIVNGGPWLFLGLVGFVVWVVFVVATSIHLLRESAAGVAPSVA